MEIKKKMCWENLIKSICPFCDGELRDGVVDIRCTKCSFHIERERAISIIERTAIQNQPGYQKKHWQNLHEKRCPACGNDLQTIYKNNLEILKCGNEECIFSITIDRYIEILNDPEHSANKFRKVTINPYTYEKEIPKRHKMRDM